MRPLTLALLCGMLSSGCFSRPAEEPPPEVVQPSPAQRAQEELAAIQARLNAMPMPDRNTLRGHGALLSRSDATARAAVTLAQELRQSLLSAPAMQTDGDLAATAPRLAARVASLRDALDVHSALLRSLTMIPLPPADPAMEGEEPVPGVVEAAVELEAATSGQWPMKRVYTAYAFELEAIADEARKLAECGQTCPDGVASRALALAEEADRLAGLLAEFAALYC
jgi:hypothetical protein